MQYITQHTNLHTSCYGLLLWLLTTIYYLSRNNFAIAALFASSVHLVLPEDCYSVFLYCFFMVLFQKNNDQQRKNINLEWFESAYGLIHKLLCTDCLLWLPFRMIFLFLFQKIRKIIG